MCCPLKDYRIIFAHGDSTGIQQFTLPKGCNVITMSILGKPLTLNKKFDQYLMDYYRSGKFIFAKKDKSYNLSKDGKALVKRLRTVFDVDIRNHVGSIKMNDQLLDFNCPIEMCNIYCDKQCHPVYSTTEGYLQVKKIFLSDLIDKEGYSASYILIACRNFDTCDPELQRKARKTSFDIPITDYDQYQED